MKKKLTSLLLATTMCFSLAIPAFAAPVGNFTDTSDTAWYAESVEYATEHNLFSGTSATTFSPDGSMTRGMFVTVLSKMSGVDANQVQDNKVFSDVNFDDYFGPCVVWAYENGIVSGTGHASFSPNASITREEIAVMLQKYLTNLGVEVVEDENSISAFQDIDKASSWAVDAVNAMRKWGFVSGDEKGNYNPKKNITRAEAASILTHVNYYLETGKKYETGSNEAATGEIQGVTISAKSLKLTVGDNSNISAFVTPTVANQEVIYTSSDSSVVSVDNYGAIKAVAPGTATITASAGGKTATCEVTVEKVNLAGTAKTFESADGSFEYTTSVYGEQNNPGDIIYYLRFNDFEHNYTDVTYDDDLWPDFWNHYSFESSDPSVIKVNEDGGLYDPIVLGPDDAPRTAIITVTKENDGYIKIPVTVSYNSVWIPVDDEYITDFVNEVHRYTNEIRANAGLSTLRLMEGATELANYRCKELADNFSHTRPEGAPDLIYTDIDGSTVNLAQENIAYIGLNYDNGGVTTTPEELAKSVVDNWYESPGHRDVMMNPYNEKMAVGLYITSANELYGNSVNGVGKAYMVSYFH